MAGRAHKKLLSQQLAVAQPGPSEEEEDESSEEEEAPAAPFNPFSLLTVRDRRKPLGKLPASPLSAAWPLTASPGPVTAQDDEDEGAAQQDSDNEQPSSPEAPPPPPRPAAATVGSGSRKRGGKSKKKGGRRGGAEDSDEETMPVTKGKAAADEEDLDAILQELNLQVGCRLRGKSGLSGWLGPGCFAPQLTHPTQCSIPIRTHPAPPRPAALGGGHRAAAAARRQRRRAAIVGG